jgi:chromosome segregation ATPase
MPNLFDLVSSLIEDEKEFEFINTTNLSLVGELNNIIKNIKSKDETKLATALLAVRQKNFTPADKKTLNILLYCHDAKTNPTKINQIESAINNEGCNDELFIAKVKSFLSEHKLLQVKKDAKLREDKLTAQINASKSNLKNTEHSYAETKSDAEQTIHRLELTNAALLQQIPDLELQITNLLKSQSQSTKDKNLLKKQLTIAKQETKDSKAENQTAIEAYKSEVASRDEIITSLKIQLNVNEQASKQIRMAQEKELLAYKQKIGNAATAEEAAKIQVKTGLGRIDTLEAEIKSLKSRLADAQQEVAKKTSLFGKNSNTIFTTPSPVPANLKNLLSTKPRI